MTSYDHVSQHRDEPQQHVGRFDCNICLESVSDDPVVTQCGHLYCWPCLFTWLEPGLTIEEKRHLGIPLYGNRTSSNNNDDSQNADFPFDDAAVRAQTFLRDFIRNTRRIHELQQGLTGIPDNTNTTARTNNGNSTRTAVSPRSCCPTCKAPCSVLNIIPLYVRHSDDDDNMNNALTEPVSVVCAPASTSVKGETEHNDNEDVNLDDDDDVGYESNTPLEMEDADVSQEEATRSSIDLGLRRRRPTSSSDSTEGTSNVADTTITGTTHLNRLLRNNGGVPPRPSAPSSTAINTTSSNRLSVGGGGSFQEQQPLQQSATSSSFYPPRPPAPGSLQMVQQQQQQRNGGGNPSTSGSRHQQSSSTATGSFFITSGPFRLVSLPTATTNNSINDSQGLRSSSGTDPNPSQNNNNNHYGDGQQQLPVDSNSNYLHQDHEGRVIPFFNNNNHSSADHGETSTQQIEDATTEFLSRLMLMLGSFVLLVLLLF